MFARPTTSGVIRFWARGSIVTLGLMADASSHIPEAANVKMLPAISGKSLRRIVSSRKTTRWTTLLI